MAQVGSARALGLFVDLSVTKMRVRVVGSTGRQKWS